MQATAVRDLNDWVTGFASLQDWIQAKLASPPPEYGTEKNLSSVPLGWRGLAFSQHDLAQAGPLPVQEGRHLLILGLGHGRLVEEGRAGRRDHAFGPGSVALLPAGTAGWRTATALRCCIITMDAKLVDRTAAQTWQAAPGDFTLEPLVRRYDFGVIGLAGALADEVRRGARGNNLYVNSMASVLAVHLLRHYAMWRRNAPEADKGTAFERTLNAPEPVQRAIVHIRENHTRDLGVQQVAAVAGIDAFQLKRLFYEAVGTEPPQYLLQLRMRSAQSLLAAGARSLPEIAQAVGFGDQGALIARPSPR